MTAALIGVGIVAYLAAYFYIGWRLALKDLPHLWARVRRRRYSESVIHSEVHSGTVSTVLFWPLRLPFIWAASVADQYDPVEIEAERNRQEARISELERELQIKRRP